MNGQGYSNDLNKQGAPRPTLTPIGEFKPDGATFQATLEPIPILQDRLVWQGVAIVAMTVIQAVGGPAAGAAVSGVVATILPALGIDAGPVAGSLAGAGLSPFITLLTGYTVQQARADIQHGVPSIATRAWSALGRKPRGCLNTSPACSWAVALVVFIMVSVLAATGCTFRVAGLEGQVAKIATGHKGFCTEEIAATVKAYSPDAEYVVSCPTECPATMTAFTVVSEPVCTVYRKD